MSDVYEDHKQDDMEYLRRRIAETKAALKELHHQRKYYRKQLREYKNQLDKYLIEEWF